MLQACICFAVYGPWHSSVRQLLLLLHDLFISGQSSNATAASQSAVSSPGKSKLTASKKGKSLIPPRVPQVSLQLWSGQHMTSCSLNFCSSCLLQCMQMVAHPEPLVDQHVCAAKQPHRQIAQSQVYSICTGGPRGKHLSPHAVTVSSCSSAWCAHVIGCQCGRSTRRCCQ